MSIDPLKLNTKTQLSHTFFAFAKEEEFAGVERKAGGFPQGGMAGPLSGPPGAAGLWAGAGTILPKPESRI